MDKLATYRQLIRSVLRPYTSIVYANMKVENRAAFDAETDQYIILSEGWNGNQHLHGILIHIEIMDGKVWIQVDGIAERLFEKVSQ